jgi:hypothetical protein
MISTEKNPRATIIVAIEPKDTSQSGDARHAEAGHGPDHEQPGRLRAELARAGENPREPCWMRLSL